MNFLCNFALVMKNIVSNSALMKPAKLVESAQFRVRNVTSCKGCSDFYLSFDYNTTESSMVKVVSMVLFTVLFIKNMIKLELLS